MLYDAGVDALAFEFARKDHLREGARTVGADRIVIYARDIERSAKQQSWHDVTAQAAELKTSLNTLSTLFPGCGAIREVHVRQT